MDIRVVEGDHNQVNVFTNSGIQLVGTEAATLSFNAAGHGDAERAVERRSRQAQASARITLKSPTGGSMDLIATKSIRSGKIAAYLEMRDTRAGRRRRPSSTQLAAAMAQALSD